MQPEPQQRLHSSQVFHERAAEYDRWFEDSLLFAIELAAIRSLNIRFSSPALEVGVGPGRFAQALHIPMGLDPAFAPLLLANRRQILTCQAIAEELPFATASLHAIFLFFTLCFLESPPRFIQECTRTLKPHAPLVIGFIPADSIWGRHLRQKKEAGHPFYQSARFFTIAQVEHLLDQHGYHVVQGASTLYQPPENLVSCEQPRVGLDEGAGFVVMETRHNAAQTHQESRAKRSQKSGNDLATQPSSLI